MVQVQSDIIVIDITQLHVNQLNLFHRIIEIADDVDDPTRVRINRTEFNHLINNFNEVAEEEEKEEEVEEERGRRDRRNRRGERLKGSRGSFSVSSSGISCRGDII